MIRLHSHDDRGRPIRLVRFAPVADGADRPSPRRLAGQAWAVTRSVLLSPPGRWVLLVGALGVVMTWLTVRFGTQVIAYTLFSPVSSIIIVLACLLMVACVNWARERGTQIKQESIRAGKCPACGYGLGEVPPSEDGCVVCPECGAAWRLSDHLVPDDGARVIVVRGEPGEREAG